MPSLTRSAVTEPRNFKRLSATQAGMRSKPSTGLRISGIWFGWSLIENSRYWNAFGTRSPKQSKEVPICSEMNFPLSRIDRRISGAVAEDERGGLFIVHRGQIGGGRKGIGAELFWNRFDGSPSTVVDGDRDTEMVVVGALNSPKLLQHIQFRARG